MKKVIDRLVAFVVLGSLMVASMAEAIYLSIEHAAWWGIGLSVVLAIVFMVAMCIFVTHGGLLVKTFEGENLLMCKNDVIRYLEDDEIHWRWDKKIKGWYTIQFKTFGRVEMNLRPITANPKVRDLVYDVLIQLSTDDPSVLKDYVQTQHVVHARDWTTDVKRALFDVNEAKSTRLAEFFNPLREEQQTQFQELMKKELAPLLPRGLNVVHANFHFN